MRRSPKIPLITPGNAKALGRSPLPEPSSYQSGRFLDWLKTKNATTVKRKPEPRTLRAGRSVRNLWRD
jgi:hypothetical protein